MHLSSLRTYSLRHIDFLLTRGVSYHNGAPYAPPAKVFLPPAGSLRTLFECLQVAFLVPQVTSRAQERHLGKSLVCSVPLSPPPEALPDGFSARDVSGILHAGRPPGNVSAKTPGRSASRKRHTLASVLAGCSTNHLF